MWKRLAPSRTKKLSTSWVMILRLTGKGKVAHCGLCFFYFFIMPVLGVYMEHFDEIKKLVQANKGLRINKRQRIAQILGIDTQFVEMLGDNSITIGNREQRISLYTKNLQALFKNYSLDFSFLNCKINNNQNSPTNDRNIGINNSNETQGCEFENCEFDDFCVSSWLIANLRFVDCSFNEKLKIYKVPNY